MLWGLKVFSVEVTNVGFKGFYEGQWLRARLCCRKISDSIFLVILLYPTLTWPVQCLAQRRSIRNIKKIEKIGTDRRRKLFFQTFLYLPGEWTNPRYVPRHSVVPKHQIVKTVLSVRRHYPKRGRFTENLSIYLFFTGSKFATPKSF